MSDHAITAIMLLGIAVLLAAVWGDHPAIMLMSGWLARSAFVEVRR